MKRLLCVFAAVLTALCVCGRVDAEPYGPTLNEVVSRYAATRGFAMLNESLSREQINIRLGMTREEVEQWAASSTVYALSSKEPPLCRELDRQKEAGDTWTYTFDTRDFDVSRLSFEVGIARGKVVFIKTLNVNNFEAEDSDLWELKALDPVRTGECWIRQDYVDPNSYENGYDFVLETYRGVPEDDMAACMGSDRAGLAVGQPGFLYPKHVRKK